MKISKKRRNSEENPKHTNWCVINDLKRFGLLIDVLCERGSHLSENSTLLKRPAQMSNRNCNQLYGGAVTKSKSTHFNSTMH